MELFNSLTETQKQIRIHNLKYQEEKQKQYYETRKQKLKKIYTVNPELKKQSESFSRGLGFKPINNYFEGATHHHLHLEGNTEFIIYIPQWLHKMYFHNPTTREGMDTINAVSLSYWLNDNGFF